MRVAVIVHPNSKKERVEKDLFDNLHVFVNQPPLEGKANQATISILANHFKVSKANIRLVSGAKSKHKLFEVESNQKGFAPFFILIAFFLLFSISAAAFFIFNQQSKSSDQVFNKPPLSFGKEIINEQPIILTGNEILEITDTHYIQKNDITLKDNAKLIIRNSFFEHLGDSSFKYWLNAKDKAQVIVENSKIRSTPWLNWNFYNFSSLTLLNVDQSNSGIWHYFPDDSKVTAKNASFHGTLDNNAQADIDGSKDTFIELVFLPGSEVDESLPKVVNGGYVFPNSNDKIPGKMKLSLKSSTAPNWGITVTEEDKVTIRDTENLTVTFSFGFKFINETIELSGLKSKTYTDNTWNFKNSYLRLINTKTNRWSPIVGVKNTLIIKNSELADNAFSNSQAKIFIESSTAQFLRAKDEVTMNVKNSEVEGDVVAEDNGKIILINTKVGGKKVEKGNGKILDQ